MYQVNFHCHSTASDGAFAPSVLVRTAKANGIGYLAVTDHDTLAGQREAAETARNCGIRYLPGIELAAAEHRYLHIVGLGVSLAESKLSALCRELKNGREERNRKIITYLHTLGMELSLDEVIEEAGGRKATVGRPHFAKVLLKKGCISSVDEAFQTFFSSEDYQKIERRKPSAKECIDAIHDAGGLAVLAHPCQLSCSEQALTALICQLKEKGLDGMECRYPQHTEAFTRLCFSIAASYDLFASAGTDFHGGGVHPESLLTPYPLSSIERIRTKFLV